MARQSTIPTGNMGRELKALKEYFGDLPVKEAQASIILQPNADDIANGIPGDPEHCAFALAARRSFGSKRVLIFGRTAYLDMLDTKGEPCVMRTLIPRVTHTSIVEFDGKSKDKVKPASFSFEAPSRTQTRKAISERFRKMRAKQAKAAKATKRSGRPVAAAKKSKRHVAAGKASRRRTSVTLNRFATFVANRAGIAR